MLAGTHLWELQPGRHGAPKSQPATIAAAKADPTDVLQAAAQDTTGLHARLLPSQLSVAKCLVAGGTATQVVARRVMAARYEPGRQFAGSP